MRADIRPLILFIVGFAGCIPASADEQFVAATFSKAAIYIYSSDFIYEPVTKWFDEEELAVLEKHSAELNLMIQNALDLGQSVGGAALSAHFKLEENIPLLRHRLLWPGTVYGWEGPDYDSEEDYLADDQFVYHSVYLSAMEEIKEQPIHEVVQPTQREIQKLFRLMEDPKQAHYYWAKWMARKLMLLEPAP